MSDELLVMIDIRNCMKNIKVNPQPLSAYIIDEERMNELEAEFAEATDLMTLCTGAIRNVYETELADFDNKNVIIASRCFVMSIMPLLKNYKGGRSLENIRSGISKYVLVKKGGSSTPWKPKKRNEEIKVQNDFSTYITDKKRLAEIEKTLAEATNYKDLCLGVIGDIYNKELADNAKRDKIIVSLPFVRSIVPYVKNLEGPCICNVRNIRKGIDHYLFGKKRDKGKRKSHAYLKEHGKRKNPIIYPFMDYITDDKRKSIIIAALSKVTNLKSLCHDVIWNVYTTELAEMEDKNAIIVSKRFVESLLPYMNNFQGKLTFSNVHDAIRRYVLTSRNEKLRGRKKL